MNFQVAITGEDSFFILKYDKDSVENASTIEDDGIEEAFEVIG